MFAMLPAALQPIAGMLALVFLWLHPYGQPSNALLCAEAVCVALLIVLAGDAVVRSGAEGADGDAI